VNAPEGAVNDRNKNQEAREAILDALAEGDDVSADDLVKRVVDEEGVAPMTFKRARKALREEGAIRRSGGGKYGVIRWALNASPAHRESSGSLSVLEPEKT
jgi:Fe2+ or Zn2+ uptake regulation protein